MKYLNAQTLQQIISPLEVITAVEKAMVLYETSDYYMPPRPHFDRGENTVLLMPCFTSSSFGTKLVGVFPSNVRRNLAAIQGLMVLNSAETGEALAIMDAGALTALRTAAIGAVSIKHLAKKHPRSLGVIGTGKQGVEQAVFAAQIRDIQDIWLCNRSKERLEGAYFQLKKRLPTVNLHLAENATQLLQNVEVVITATNSSTPILPNDAALLEGKHFVGIGSFKPSMREFPQALFPLLEEVYTDTTHALEECGDLAVPLAAGWIQASQVKRLGKVIGGTERIADCPTTFYKSVGMALLDVVVAEAIYQKACELEMGQDLV